MVDISTAHCQMAKGIIIHTVLDFTFFDLVQL